MARRSDSRKKQFEVSTTEQRYASFGQALNRAQLLAEKLGEVGAVYVYQVGENHALARAEHQQDGAVVTFVNGRDDRR